MHEHYLVEDVLNRCGVISRAISRRALTLDTDDLARSIISVLRVALPKDSSRTAKKNRGLGG